MKVRRFDAIRHTGNIAKHNFTRLERTVQKIRNILRENGHERSMEECYSILPELQEWFHNHAFVGLSSAISEHLNNIRWAIHNYLMDEFRRAYAEKFDEKIQFRDYWFDIPEQMKKAFARDAYYHIMNLVRAGPILPKFTINPHFRSVLS